MVVCRCQIGVLEKLKGNRELILVTSTSFDGIVASVADHRQSLRQLYAAVPVGTLLEAMLKRVSGTCVQEEHT